MPVERGESGFRAETAGERRGPAPDRGARLVAEACVGHVVAAAAAPVEQRRRGAGRRAERDEKVAVPGVLCRKEDFLFTAGDLLSAWAGFNRYARDFATVYFR